jgi:hypothetical protein
MLPILDVFLQIALRRRGPEDLPDSRFLLLMAGLAYVVTQAFLAVPVYHSALEIGGSLLLDLLLLYGCLWGLLRFTGNKPRFRQTLTAIFGTSSLLSVCMLPINYWFPLSSWLGLSVDPTKPPLVIAIGALAILVWWLVVNGHIFSRALSAPMAVGLAIAVGYYLLSNLVLGQIWQPAAI